jgi:hypothetical protein
MSDVRINTSRQPTTMSDLAYVKLIKSSCGLWPSFEPTRQVRLGDYGYIDRGSLTLQVEGNIFDEGAAERCGVRAAPVGKAQTSEIYKSDKTRIYETDNEADVYASVPLLGLAQTYVERGR